MATKGTRVTEREKTKMWLLYTEGELNFKQIGKKMRRSPDTVAKYIHQKEYAIGTINNLLRK